MAPPRLSVNDNYFKIIDTSQKAYWLGFIAADGCLLDTRPVLSIGLQIQDKSLLEQLRDDLGYEGMVHTYNHCVQLRLTSKEIKTDLMRLGITPRKSLTLTWPQIEKSFYPDFIRGYFDGDGSWSIRQRGNYTGVIFQLVSGSPIFLGELENELRLNCSLNKKALYKIKNTNCFELKYGGNLQCRKIYDFLYTLNSFHLQRKRNKVISILERPNNNV